MSILYAMQIFKHSSENQANVQNIFILACDYEVNFFLDNSYDHNYHIFMNLILNVILLPADD